MRRHYVFLEGGTRHTRFGLRIDNPHTPMVVTMCYTATQAEQIGASIEHGGTLVQNSAARCTRRRNSATSLLATNQSQQVARMRLPSVRRRSTQEPHHRERCRTASLVVFTERWSSVLRPASVIAKRETFCMSMKMENLEEVGCWSQSVGTTS